MLKPSTIKAWLPVGAIALSLVSVLVLRPTHRAPELEGYAYHHPLPPLGMMTPQKRYRLPYNPQWRGSGRRKLITTNALG